MVRNIFYSELWIDLDLMSRFISNSTSCRHNMSMSFWIKGFSTSNFLFFRPRHRFKIGLTLFMTCSVTYTCHRIHLIPIWKFVSVWFPSSAPTPTCPCSTVGETYHRQSIWALNYVFQSSLVDYWHKNAITIRHMNYILIYKSDQCNLRE